MVDIYQEFGAHLVVRSSPGKYHYYWKLERGADMEVWRKLQIGIANRLTGDLQLSLPTSMIRVPGFPRISKEGKQIMPSVMTFSDENEVCALSIKKLVKMWPWIWEASEKGEAVLAKQRKDAARIAREMMKARGTEYDSAKFARMTPDAGRNNTLYLASCEAVHSADDDITFEDLLSFGDDLNKSFKTPLGQAEVVKTVSSAFNHARIVKAKRVREQRKILKTLEKNSGQEKRKIKKELKAEVNNIIVKTILGPEKEVPESYLDISDILISDLWTSTKGKERTTNHNILASAYRTKYFKKLSDFLVHNMKRCGAFKVSGYSVYLRGVNESGEAVRYRKNLDHESLSALLQDILSRLYLHAVKVSMNGKKDKAKSEGLISHLEGSAHAKEKKKTRKNKASKHTKVQRDKTDGRGNTEKDAARAGTKNTVT
jgi:hypothetical protein